MIFLTFFIGLIANFIGYIPPGNINMALVQIAINRGIKQAMQFIIAFSCVEFFFTYFIMNAADWLSQQVHLDTAIDWVMVVLFGVMGVITWKHRKKAPESKKIQNTTVLNTVLYIIGLLKSSADPFLDDHRHLPYHT